MVTPICTSYEIISTSSGNMTHCLTVDPDFSPGGSGGSCRDAALQAQHFGTFQLCNGTDYTQPCTNYSGGAGVTNADAVLYVTAMQVDGCAGSLNTSSGFLAYTTACFFDPVTSRPILGNVNVCPAVLSADPYQFDTQVGVLIHELIHFLGAPLPPSLVASLCI